MLSSKHLERITSFFLDMHDLELFERSNVQQYVLNHVTRGLKNLDYEFIARRQQYVYAASHGISGISILNSLSWGFFEQF